MDDRVVPMIHVPDVRATVDWYRAMGFTVIATYGNGRGGLSFAVVSFGRTQVMFNQGGQTSTQKRREVDLYVYTDNIDDIYDRLKDRVEIVETPHDTLYGMREVIIRDLNRFWITFGQPTVFEMLMNGIREGSAETVREALSVGIEKGGLKPEMLGAALADVSGGANQNSEIAELLRKAGAVAPAEVNGETLQSYAGDYKSEDGFEINVTSEDGRLYATPAGDPTMSLVAVDETTFRPVAFDLGTITFTVAEGKTRGCVLTHGSNTMQLNRVDN